MSPIYTLTSRVAKTVREQKLLESGDTLILGLSGGADSVALLDVLSNLPGIPLQIIAAHLNHCLRGAESDDDQEFCQNLAKQYGIPCDVRRIDVKAFAKEKSLNLEDAGRRSRYAFFDELMTSHNARAVAVAHHADDQAETFLMRMLRGSGMSGLRGMSYCNNRGYVRPLLNISRHEIECYLTQRQLHWRNDSSNSDQTFLRNRIRHELLPLLEKYNPSIRECLTTTASILSAENDLLSSQTVQTAADFCQQTPQGIACDVNQLLALPLALQRRTIRQILTQLLNNLEQFNFNHIELIIRMIESGRPNAQLHLPQGILVIREYHRLIFRSANQHQPHGCDQQIDGPGTHTLPGGYMLTIEGAPAPAHYDNQCADTAFFDQDKAPFPWQVRMPLPGDRLQPLGMAGSKKLKDLFIDSKIPLTERRQIPLIFSEEKLIWVCGLRTSQVASLDEKTTGVVKVVFSRPE